jgi:hypothetical protein
MGEAVRHHERLGAAVRAARQELQGATLLGTQFHHRGRFIPGANSEEAISAECKNNGLAQKRPSQSSYEAGRKRGKSFFGRVAGISEKVATCALEHRIGRKETKKH